MTRSASEELLAVPLPEMVRDLGVAVAVANKELATIPDNNLAYTIPSAEIEVNIAITLSKESKMGIEAGGNISVFSVNASYARTFGYKEEASSRLKITLAAKPKLEA